MSTHNPSDLPEIHEGGYGSPMVEDEMPDSATAAGAAAPSAEDDADAPERSND